MKKYILIVFIISLFSVVLFNGCEDKSKLTAPTPLNGKSGNADLTTYVAIGNSLTAGYQSGTIYESAQMYAFPNLIAKQVGVKLEGPTYSDPGVGGRLEIQSLSPFTLYTNTNSGVPLNSTFPGPYGNLGIPGALVYDVLFATNANTCASAVFANTPNPYFDLVLRNSALSIGTQLQQALAQQPTFMTLWIGNNDVLGYATSGGTAPTAPTSTAQFTQLFQGIAGTLGQASVPVVVANIPSVTSIPFFTTVGPQMVQNGVPVLVYFKGDNASIGVASQNDLLSSNVLVTLRGSAYAPYIGQATDKFYTDNGIPVPPNVNPDSLFGVSPFNPWPNALILDPDEITIANNAVNDYNNVISGSAQAFNFGLVDINQIFQNIRQNDATPEGTVYNGVGFKTTFVTGGIFSLDGVHPSSQGQGIVANEFLKVINSKFNASFPLVDVSQIPGSLIFTGKISFKDGYPILPKEMFDHLLF